LQIINSNNKNNTTDTSSLLEALKQRGVKFESDIKKKLDNKVDCENKSYKDLLGKVQVGQIFYQMKFDIPESFYNEVGIKDIVKLQRFVPDFIEVLKEDGKEKLMVKDAKFSKSTKISHLVWNNKNLT
jgi:DNA replication ATP-dependent helicase Dna2